MKKTAICLEFEVKNLATVDSGPSLCDTPKIYKVLDTTMKLSVKIYNCIRCWENLVFNLLFAYNMGN